MICGKCEEKMVLKRVGIISLGLGYECPKCGLRDGFHLYEIYDNPTLELQEMLDELDDMLLRDPIENKEEWLRRFDEVLDKQGIKVYSQTPIDNCD